MEKLKINFKPALGKVLLKKDKLPETTKSGIIIPDQVNEEKRSIFGTVLAVGKDTVDHPMYYKEGDRVIITRYGGMDVEFTTNEEKNPVEILTIIDQIEIMGKIKDEPLVVYPLTTKDSLNEPGNSKGITSVDTISMQEAQKVKPSDLI